jgi:5-methyltetrahydrofolate corrinoid/iron sulfur protein methyltransferase
MAATEAGLKVAKKAPLINSISIQSSRFETGMKMAKQYGADFIALLWSDEGMPRDANERAMHIVDFVQKATELDIPMEKIWFDPIVTPISVEVNQVKACVECMGMLRDIAPGARSVVGLSNVSNGVPDKLRTWLNIPYLIMLMKNGLQSAIVDAFDSELTNITRGGKQNIYNLVHRMMDGEKVKLNSLNDEERKYAKSVRVLTGETLYSDSWLEI